MTICAPTLNLPSFVAKWFDVCVYIYIYVDCAGGSSWQTMLGELLLFACLHSILADVLATLSISLMLARVAGNSPCC